MDVKKPASFQAQHNEDVEQPEVAVGTTAKSMAMASRR